MTNDIHQIAQGRHERAEGTSHGDAPRGPSAGGRPPTGADWRGPETGGDFDFVADRIATGGAIWDEEDVAALRAAGITHVVTAAIELEEETRRVLAGRFVHLANGVDDDGQWKSPTWFGRTIDFALDALRDPEARILLHCGAGINRGPSSAYAVLRALGHSRAEAHRVIADARPIAGVLYASDADEAIDALGLDRSRRSEDRREGPSSRRRGSRRDGSCAPAPPGRTSLVRR